MPFTIPNAADAFNANQAEPDSVDFDILTFGSGVTGVVSGCAVAAQGTPDMTVAVAAGNVRIAGMLIQVAAGNGTITTADGSNPRFDLVSINTSGAIVVTAGTAAAEPVFPAHPADDVVLAAVYIPTSDTTIADNQITDKRVVGGAVAPTGSLLYRSGVSFSPTIPIQNGSSIAGNHSADTWYSWAFVVGATVEVDAVSLEVASAGAANVRIGLYEGDGADFVAKTLLFDTGDIDCSATGLKTVAISATLRAGVVYWIGTVSNAGNATWWPRAQSATVSPARQVGGWKKVTNLHKGALVSANSGGFTYGALPDPISAYAWDAGVGTVDYFILDVV